MSDGGMSSDSIRFAMLKAAGKEVTENLSKFLAKKGKTRHELKMGVAQFFLDSDEAEVIEEEITRDGPADGVSDPKVEVLVESKVVAQFVKRTASMDPLTKLVTSTWNGDDSKMPYWLINEDAWIRGLEGERPKGKPMFGQFAHLAGKGTGKGKTSWSVRLAQIALRHPTYHVVTNIRFTPPPEVAGRVHVVSTLRELLWWLITITLMGEYALVETDETLFFFGRQDAMSENVKGFDKLMKLFRKMHASGVLISHDFDKDVPEKAKVFCTTRFEKRSLKEMSVVIVADHYKLNLRVSDVPDADWPFESEHFGGLAMDINVQHMHDWLNSQNPGSTEHELVLLKQYLEDGRLREAEIDDAPSGPPEVNEFEAAEEVRANRASYVNEKGKLDVAAIRMRFRVDEDTAYRIGRLAKA